MDDQHKYDIPWDLIAAGLQGDLSDEEEAQLGQWLSLNQDNREKYDTLRHTWRDALEDYSFYRQADTESGWNALQLWLRSASTAEEAKVISLRSGRGYRLMKPWMMAAAVFLIAISCFFWYYNSSTRHMIIYETMAGEQRKIVLGDGSVILIRPNTRLCVTGDYNKETRTVLLTKGAAFFEVEHEAEKPFIVNLGDCSVKDIGTSFDIEKLADSIKVTVSTGRVAFIKKATRETRELSGGMSLSFITHTNSFGTVSSLQPANGIQLQFDNTPLSVVVSLMEKKYDKRIRLSDSAIARKRLTAELDGQNIDNALQVICTSLDLVYFQRDSAYILKEKNIPVGIKINH